MSEASVTNESGDRVFRLLAEQVECYAICVLDVRGRVIHWNVGAEHILGYSAEEAIGRPIDFLFTNEDRAAEVPQQELRMADAQGRAEDARWHVRKDGS